MQNLFKLVNGRRIRQAFVPEKGYKLLSADYSQIELRVMASCGDEGLIQAFKNKEDTNSILPVKYSMFL